MFGSFPTLYEERERIARKPHRCVECQKVIAQGDAHRWAKGLWDGTWGEHRWCLECEALREEARRYDVLDDEQPAFGYLLEWIEEARR